MSRRVATVSDVGDSNKQTKADTLAMDGSFELAEGNKKGKIN